jgi:toxin ParE1/3/4
MDITHQVLWTHVAQNDLKEIFEYIPQVRPQAALKIFKNIKDKASSLFSFPERGRIVPELQSHGILQYRELVIKPWRLIYKIQDQKIFVLSVIDSRQNVEDILLNRMIRME